MADDARQELPPYELYVEKLKRDIAEMELGLRMARAELAKWLTEQAKPEATRH